MGIWSTLFGGGSGEAAEARARCRAQGRALQDARRSAARTERSLALFERALGNDPVHDGLDTRRKAAIDLVLAGELVMGREAWMAIARDYPGELSFALEQVGVSHHLERNYAAALENYEAAIRVGADPGHLADNMAEARRGLAALG